jgi:hypothetical protein
MSPNNDNYSRFTVIFFLSLFVVKRISACVLMTWPDMTVHAIVYADD